MAYFSVICVILTTMSLGSQTLKTRFTIPQKELVKSGRGVSPDSKSPWVQSALTKLADQCFFYDIHHGACSVAFQTLLCNHRYFNKPTETKEKVLFLVYWFGRMFKLTFVPGPGVVNTTRIELFRLEQHPYQTRYHQALNTLYWTTAFLTGTIHTTVANGYKRHRKKMPFRVVTFDIDSNANYMFILSENALHKFGFSTNKFETLVPGKFYRTDGVFLDKYNRIVYYTSSRASRSRQDLMRVSYDGKLNTKIASKLSLMYSFVVDDKGQNVFACSGRMHRYNINTRVSTPLESLSKVSCLDIRSDGQHIYVNEERKIFVLAMDSGAITSTLHVATQNRKPGAFKVVVSDPN